MEEAYLLTSMHRPPKRSNQDTSPPNKSGKLLLEMCLSSGILIFNGRTLGNLSGEFTFFHVVVVVVTVYGTLEQCMRPRTPTRRGEPNNPP